MEMKTNVNMTSVGAISSKQQVDFQPQALPLIQIHLYLGRVI